jgi:hypothetical protein
VVWARVIVGVVAATMAAGCDGGSSGEDVTPTPPSESAASPSDSVAPPSEPPAAAPDSLQERWWTWAATEGFDTNPVADLTGEFCDRNQPGDVWFFAGTFGETAQRVCTVPAGLPIAAPVVNLFSDLPADCDAFMAEAAGTANLDGEPLSVDTIPNEEITIEGVAGNPVTGEAGQLPVVACGLWIQIDPPAAGTHELQIRGESGDFAVSVDYTFDVIE